jgi:hypothetical protein
MWCCAVCSGSRTAAGRSSPIGTRDERGPRHDVAARFAYCAHTRLSAWGVPAASARRRRPCSCR